MRVLGVDDDALARMAISKMVTSLGHECLLAADGIEAWHLLQQQAVDVVISDRMMPELDGLELCRRIRSNLGGQGYVYVVLSTALGEDDDAYEGMAAGADEYLTKPLRLAPLRHKLLAAERVTTMHRQLESARADLTASNQAQADMIAMLAHDARQPLTAIIGYSEAVLDDWQTSADDVKRSMVTRIADTSRRLDELIEDVLTLSNLDSGALNCRPESLLLAPALHDVAANSPENARIDVIVDPELRATVDPWHLRQILANLVGNAVKYGSPPITLSAVSTPDGVSVQVTDQGEGVPSEFIPHLFERFSRATTGIATRKTGTGFGLYIIQQLAQVNDGHISYTPGHPQGSIFTLILPPAF